MHRSWAAEMWPFMGPIAERAEDANYLIFLPLSVNLLSLLPCTISMFLRKMDNPYFSLPWRFKFLGNLTILAWVYTGKHMQDSTLDQQLQVMGRFQSRGCKVGKGWWCQTFYKQVQQPPLPYHHLNVTISHCLHFWKLALLHSLAHFMNGYDIHDLDLTIST